MKTKELGEYSIIELLKTELKKLFPQNLPEPTIGIGDDAAVWPPSPNKKLAWSCDAAVEGVHFPQLSELTPELAEKIGQKIATANLSDLAAMAALPKFALISIGLSGEEPLNLFKKIYLGIAKKLSKYNCSIIGGNITSTKGPLWFDVSIIGEIPKGKPLKRTGSKPKDLIWLTGYPGSSAAGLLLFLHRQNFNQKKYQFPTLTEAYFNPEPRIKEAQLLSPYIRALTDISDGLPLDLQNLLAETELGALLWEEKFPILNELQNLAKILKVNPLSIILGPSDDYELLFTSPPENKEKIAKLSEQTETKISQIGEIIEQPGLFLKTKSGPIIPIPPKGWEHFK